MGKGRYSRFVLCGACRGLYEVEPTPGYATPQRCECRRTREPTWPGKDFNEHLHLCECCRLDPRRSGSRWSVWFCDGCKLRVIDLNRQIGRCVIPIGRHSLMAGVGIAGSDLVQADDRRLGELVARFGDRTQGLFDAMDHLHAFAADRTAVLTDAVGLAGDTPLDTWLGLVRPLAGAEPTTFGREGSFEALVRWFASG